MEILTILGDSLSLRRAENEIFEKDIYSFLLQEKIKNTIFIINKSQANNTSEIQNSFESFICNIKGAQSRFFVIQLGIVDCAPRLFKKRTKQILDLLSGIPIIRNLSSYYIKYKSANRLKITKRKLIREVSPKQFDSNIRSIIEKIKNNNPIKKIWLINIAYPGDYLQNRSFGIIEIINEYNAILEKIRKDNKTLIDIIDVYSFTSSNPSFILPDGHHITVDVHKFIASEIYKHFVDIL